LRFRVRQRLEPLDHFAEVGRKRVEGGPLRVRIEIVHLTDAGSRPRKDGGQPAPLDGSSRLGFGERRVLLDLELKDVDRKPDGQDNQRSATSDGYRDAPARDPQSLHPTSKWL